MTTTRAISLTALKALVAALAVAPVALPAPADAKGGGSTWYETNIQTDKPVHGYSGPGYAGPRSLYCDYQRLPKHDCKVGPNGEGRCKIVGWTLKQYCY